MPDKTPSNPLLDINQKRKTVNLVQLPQKGRVSVVRKSSGLEQIMFLLKQWRNCPSFLLLVSIIIEIFRIKGDGTNSN